MFFDKLRGIERDACSDDEAVKLFSTVTYCELVTVEDLSMVEVFDDDMEFVALRSSDMLIDCVGLIEMEEVQEALCTVAE